MVINSTNIKATCLSAALGVRADLLAQNQVIDVYLWGATCLSAALGV
jgi:hypothetical protein